MSVYFIGCLHLGHANIAKKRGWSSVAAHDSAILNVMMALTKRDKLFILGDLSMENSRCYQSLCSLRCVTHVVLGNHDRHKDVNQLTRRVDQVSGCLTYKKKAILTHIPVHPSCLGDRYQLNIHAHIHDREITTYNMNDNQIIDKRYINVDVHKLNYKPLSWDNIIKTI